MYTVRDQVGHSLFLFCFVPWEISQVSWLGHVQGEKWIPQSVKDTFLYRVFLGVERNQYQDNLQGQEFLHIYLEQVHVQGI